MRFVRALACMVASCALLAACAKASGCSCAPTPSSSARPARLENLAVTFSVRRPRGGGYAYELGTDRALVHYADGRRITRLKLAERELAPLDALLQDARFADAVKRPRAEIGDVDSYHVAVTSTAFNAAGDGYLLDSRGVHDACSDPIAHHL